MNESDGDVAQLLPSISTSICNIQQLCSLLRTATSEVQNLLNLECNIILECKKCSNLFRSTANFIAHKRTYCCRPHKLNYPIANYEESYTAIQTVNNEINKKNLDHIIGKLSNNANHIANDGILCVSSQTPENIRYLNTLSAAVNEKINNKNDITLSLERLDNTNKAVAVNYKKNVNIIPKEDDDIGNKTIRGRPKKDIPIIVRPLSYCCEKCDIGNQNTEDVESTINRSKYSCPLCRYTFCNLWNTYRHLKAAHNKTQEQVDKLKSVIRHQGIRKNLPTSIRPASSPFISTADIHIEPLDRVSSGNDNHFTADIGDHRCGICGLKFERKAALMSHINTCHKKNSSVLKLNKTATKNNAASSLFSKTMKITNRKRSIPVKLSRAGSSDSSDNISDKKPSPPSSCTSDISVCSSTSSVTPLVNTNIPILPSVSPNKKTSSPIKLIKSRLKIKDLDNKKPRIKLVKNKTETKNSNSSRRSTRIKKQKITSVALPETISAQGPFNPATSILLSNQLIQLAPKPPDLSSLRLQPLAKVQNNVLVPCSNSTPENLRHLANLVQVNRPNSDTSNTGVQLTSTSTILQLVRASPASTVYKIAPNAPPPTILTLSPIVKQQSLEDTNKTSILIRNVSEDKKPNNLTLQPPPPLSPLKNNSPNSPLKHPMAWLPTSDNTQNKSSIQIRKDYGKDINKPVSELLQRIIEKCDDTSNKEFCGFEENNSEDEDIMNTIGLPRLKDEKMLEEILNNNTDTEEEMDAEPIEEIKKQETNREEINIIEIDDDYDDECVIVNEQPPQQQQTPAITNSSLPIDNNMRKLNFE